MCRPCCSNVRRASAAGRTLRAAHRAVPERSRGAGEGARAGRCRGARRGALFEQRPQLLVGHGQLGRPQRGRAQRQWRGAESELRGRLRLAVAAAAGAVLRRGARGARQGGQHWLKQTPLVSREREARRAEALARQGEAHDRRGIRLWFTLYCITDFVQYTPRVQFTTKFFYYLYLFMILKRSTILLHFALFTMSYEYF